MSPVAVAALFRLALARAMRRPARWLLTAAGIALAVAFAGGVVAAATIAADQSAHSVLSRLPVLERTVRVSWQDIVTPDGRRRATGLLSSLHLRDETEVVLMAPVRLSGIVVRPAAVAPLAPWLSPAGSAADPPSSCTPRACPVVLANGSLGTRTLTALGVRMPVLGRAGLVSPVPLGVIPGTGSAPVVLSGDPTGLEALPGLGGIYRTHSWVAPLPISRLHSWQLSGLERRLRQAQDQLLAGSSDFEMLAPFTGLDAARAQAQAAPRRLLLAGGGAVAALTMFVLLAAGGLRREQSLELQRLRVAGAHSGQSAAFLLAEAGLLSGVAVLSGTLLAIVGAVVLAHADGSPAGAVLTHSLLTPAGGVGIAAAWIGSSALIAGAAALRTPRLADVLAIAAIAGLALALSVNHSADSGPLPVLLAPLCCVAAGVLVFRAAAGLLRLAERAARRGPVMTRLALVGLARAPAGPSLAIAFIAVSTGLGAFSLCYRATLLRGTADQAADRVPLDAIVASGPDFTRPLELASLAGWHQLTGGAIWPVRRTDASFVNGGASVTEPALGVPAAALARIHGWRAHDGSAPLPVLARRLVPPGPARAPGPRLDPALRRLSLRVASPAVAVTVTADLRDRGGNVRRVVLGQAAGRAQTLSARLPAGPRELEAIELSEPSGLEATNGHQNAENAAAATRFTATVTLSRLNAPGVRLGDWRGVGAITSVRGVSADAGVRARVGAGAGAGARIRFATTGEPGVLRPAQPSDVRPVPVLVDSATPHGARLALTVDGESVPARVVGVLRRFPTLLAGAGFVIADEATLGAALDAQAPGQGFPDELWQLGGRTVQPFDQLTYTRRADVERDLRSAPVARGVLGTLIAGAGLAAALAIVGLLVSLLGGGRDRQVERDLVAQGVGARGLRHELRLRMTLASVLGVGAGLAIAGLLTVLAVASVRAGITLAAPHPPLVAVTPWLALTAWAVGMLAALTAAGWLASRWSGR